MRARMLAGEQYIADDSDLTADRARAKRVTRDLNNTDPNDHTTRRTLLEQLLGAIGDESEIVSPLHCDYGYQITLGARTFINAGLVCLDVAKVCIGNDVQIGSNVQLLTPTHPTDPARRLEHGEGSSP